MFAEDWTPSLWMRCTLWQKILLTSFQNPPAFNSWRRLKHFWDPCFFLNPASMQKLIQGVFSISGGFLFPQRVLQVYFSFLLFCSGRNFRWFSWAPFAWLEVRRGTMGSNTRGGGRSKALERLLNKVQQRSPEAVLNPAYSFGIQICHCNLSLQKLRRWINTS